MKKCIVFLADNNQFRGEEYNDIKEQIELESNGGIDWELYRGSEEFENLDEKHVIVVFTSDNMAECLDGENTVKLKFGKTKFELNHLRPE